jgi:hypothetical protein
MKVFLTFLLIKKDAIDTEDLCQSESLHLTLLT